MYDLDDLLVIVIVIVLCDCGSGCHVLAQLLDWVATFRHNYWIGLPRSSTTMGSDCHVLTS